MAWPAKVSLKVEAAFGDGPFAASKTWTDITDYVLGVPSAKHGRDSELAAFQAGSMTVRLDNSDRRFDPSYAAGPYYGDLLPNVPVRCRLVRTEDTPVAVDSFDRADNASSLGDADTGQTWTKVTFGDGAGTLGISSNKAYCSAVDSGLMVGLLDLGEADGYTQATFSDHDDTPVALAFRGDIGAGSVWQVTRVGGGWLLGKSVGGSFTGVQTVTLADDPVTIRAEYVGSQIDIYFDGVLRASTTDSALASETEVGFVLNTTQPRIDDFESGTLDDVSYPVGYGYAQGWPQSYSGSKGSEVTVQCPDGLGILANARIDGSPLELEIAKDEPTHWYRLDEDQGASAFTDYGSDPVDGVPRGSANPGFGATGLDAGSDATAWEADGTDAGYLDTRIALDTDWDTVAFLFSHAEQDNTTTDRRFISDGQRSISMRGGPTPKGLIDFNQNGDSNSRRTTTRTDDDDPHLIVARRTGDGAWSVYIDGAADTPTSAGAGLFNNSPATTTMGGGPGLSALNFLDGTLQHVAFFDSDKTGRAAAYEAARGGWDGDLTGERIAALLDAIGHPSGERDLDDGTITLGPSEPFTKASVLPVLQLHEATEQGKFYQEPDGTIVFHQRHAWVTATRSATSQYTFSDDGSDLLYEADLAPEYDAAQIINQAVVTWVGGQVIIRDQTSIDAYGPREQTINTLAPSAAVARSVGEYVVAQYKDPLLRFQQITLNASAGSDDLWTACLDVQVGDRVTVEKTPVNVGSQIVQESIVEAKTWRLAAGVNEAAVTLTLSPADTVQYWIWGTSEWGEADDPTTRWG